jgi:hypothetical protein
LHSFFYMGISIFKNGRAANSTLNTICSVWLYLVLLPPYPAQHLFSIPWWLVLEINVPLPFLLPPPLLYCSFPILTNTKFKHVTSTYYHSWYVVFEFTFIVIYFHRAIDIWCMCSYLVYWNVLYSVVYCICKRTMSFESMFFYLQHIVCAI